VPCRAAGGGRGPRRARQRGRTVRGRSAGQGGSASLQSSRIECGAGVELASSARCRISGHGSATVTYHCTSEGKGSEGNVILCVSCSAAIIAPLPTSFFPF